MDAKSNSLQTNFENAILKTLAYFDVFDYPLTGVEVHKFLWRQRATLRDVLEVLGVMEAAGQIGRHFGYYCLRGREEIITTRQQRYLIADPKFTRVLMVVRWLRLLPNVRLVAVCNTLAYSNAKAESDLDLFVITAPGRIWLTRLLVTGVTQLLGVRRHGVKITNRICLSFYITANAAELKKFALAPEDPYLAYWLATLAIVSARPGAPEEFWRANRWVGEWLPNFRPRVINQRRTVRPLWHWVMSPFPVGRGLDAFAKRLQQAKMARRERQRHARTPGVIISDVALKFHEEDRREYYRQEWQERLSRHGIIP